LSQLESLGMTGSNAQQQQRSSSDDVAEEIKEEQEIHQVTLPLSDIASIKHPRSDSLGPQSIMSPNLLQKQFVTCRIHTCAVDSRSRNIFCSSMGNVQNRISFQV